MEIGLAWELVCDVGLYQPLLRLFVYMSFFQEEVNQVPAGVTVESGTIKNLYVIVSDTDIARYAALLLMICFTFGPMQLVYSGPSSKSFQEKIGRPLGLFQCITASASSRPLSAARSDCSLKNSPLGFYLNKKRWDTL